MRYLLVVLLVLAGWGHAAKIAVVTASIGDEYSQIVRDCIESKRLYCQRHGYDFICGRENLDPSRPLAWSKIKLIQAYLKDYDWVFWSDADSLIMNHSILLEDFLDEESMLLVACDWNGMNTGQFLLKNCAESFELLSGAYSLTHFIYHPWWEQAAIRQYLADNPDLLSLVRIVPQRSINSYPEEIAACHPDSLYQPGDFIVHFPGVRGWDLYQSIQKYNVSDRR